ncbi:MAG: hypothetical protein ABI130_05925 [Leifsonia sp.]
MRAAALPSNIRDTAFTTSTAQKLGVTRSRLRRTDLASPFHGVRTPYESGVEPTIFELCEAFRAGMDDGQFFSHVTAATIYGLPLPLHTGSGTHILVAVVKPRRAPRGAGVIGHKLTIDPNTLREWNGFPVPDPVEVWCELAATFSIDELVIAGDALLRRKSPLAETRRLAAAVAAATNRPGAERLRLALPNIRARTDSPMETTLRLAIARARLPEPEVNWAILDAAGAFRGFADLAFPLFRVLVEYDGDHHRTDSVQYFTDVDRLWMFQSLGWRIVRINKTHTLPEAIQRIRTALSTGEGVATRRVPSS